MAVRLTAAEHDAIREAAKRAHLTVSDYVRTALALTTSGAPSDLDAVAG